MSQTHIRVPQVQSHRRPWLIVVAISGLLGLLVFAWLARSYSWFVPPFDSTSGQVLDTRIVVDGFRESQTGGHILYRLETKTRFALPLSAGGKSEGQQERWLVASEPTLSRELLMAIQAKQSKTCRVYWIENHPETAKCSLNG